jgi:hypothetical protein
VQKCRGGAEGWYRGGGTEQVVQSRCRAGAEQVQSKCRAGAEQVQVQVQLNRLCSAGGAVQWCSVGADVQHSAEVTVWVIWHVQLEVQICRGAEVVQRCSRGAEMIVLSAGC